MPLIDRRRSALLVIDVQQRLAPAIAGIQPVLARCGLLIRAALRLNIPLAFTEQSPEGLGPTVPALRDLAPEARVIRKDHFQATREPGLAAWLAHTGAEQVVVAGTEAHVCVLQTTLGLAAAGYAAFVVADAVGSRREMDRAVALERLSSAGCRIVTAEMALFEWLERAGTEEFREVLVHVKAVG